MEKKVIKEEENNGLYTKVETIETTPEDGFVHQTDIHTTGASVDDYKKYHKGYSKNVSVTINDPRITRPFTYIISLLFFTIGIIGLLVSLISINLIGILFGICFIFTGIFSFVKSKKDIDKIEKEITESKNYNTKLSNGEKALYKDLVKKNINDVTKSTFTKKNFNYLLKISLPFYCIISVLIFLLITIFINVILGLFVFIILALCGFLYYWIVSKICKWKEDDKNE